MRLSRKLTALCAFFVVAIAIAGCGSSLPGNSVASVGGNPITVQAFNHWMFVAAKGNAAESPGSPVIVPNDPPSFKNCLKQVREQIPSLAKTSDAAIEKDCSTLFTSLSSQVMAFLIEAYWYQADAHKLHITVTDKAVTKALAAAKKEQFPTTASYKTFLTETGQTEADINYRIRINQVYKDLIARLSKKVTAAAIAQYYTAHSIDFGTPAERTIRIVRTTTQAPAQAALAALKSGQSWTAVAKQYSVDTATKDDGGLLTNVTNGEEEHALNVVAFSSPVGKLEGPIHGTFGWYVVEVVSIKPATTETLAKATPLIKSQLTSQYETAAENSLNKISMKDWGTQTTCRAAYSMSDCHGYVAPKTTTTAAPTTTTGATSTGTTSTGTTSPSTTSTGTTSTGTTSTGTTSTTSTTAKKKK